MAPTTEASPRDRERGQLFSAWILGIFVIAAMIVYVMAAMRQERLSTQDIIYRELAMNVARAGFEQAESYFRTHSSGCYLTGAEAPTSQAWVTPWPAYPDEAFEPQSTDTDFYSSISVSCGICPGQQCAGGIIGDVPMDQFVTFTTSEDSQSCQLWGRYVIRRQNTQDWSPGPDTATVNTDPDACHDISAIAAQSPLGSGARWSIVSRGYLIRLPQPITTTSVATSLLGNPAAFNGGDLLSAPVTFYNGQPFLMGQARVYGEISRVNFNLPAAAAVVPYSTTSTVGSGGAATLLVDTGGLLNGGFGGSAYAANATGSANEGTCASCVYGGQDPLTATASLSGVFPGQSWSTLQATAAALGSGSTISGYTSAADLPVYNGFNSATGLSYSAQIAVPTFYYIGSSLTLPASSNSTVLSGVGLCVVQGSLTIPQGNPSTFNGIIYASGKITLNNPATVNGIVISATCVELDGTAVSKATVTYEPDMIDYVQKLLQGFTVDSSSIVATGF